MSANAIVWSVTLVALVVVIALAAARAARALRELKRFKARVGAYSELPVFASLTRAEADLERIAGSLECVATLVERAQAALEIIRRGPIPPELIVAAQRVKAEIAVLRRFASR